MEQTKNLKKRSLIIFTPLEAARARSVSLPLMGLTFSVFISFLFVSLITYGVTTIGSNINTDGTLVVQGRINASSTLQATGATRFYSTARIDGATILNTVSYTWPSSDGSASTYLQTNGAGTLSWATVSSGANSDWLKQTNFGVLNLTASTTIPYWAKDAIYASSTLQVQGLTTLANATTSLLTVSNGAWFTNGNIGIGTTSPWGLLSINPNGISGPSFVIGSSTATNFVITNSGNVGIGTTSPGSLFSLNNIANFTTATSSFYGNGINLANGCFAINGTCAGGGGGSGTINSGTTGQLSYYGGSGTTLTATSSLFIHSNQNIGVGTTTPNWLLQAAGTRPFFALSDMGAAANNKHWFLSSQGGNFYVGTSSDAYATSTVSALTINSSGNVGIATSSPSGLFSIENVGTGYTFYATDSANDTTPFVIDASGNVGIGTTSPFALLSVAGSGFFNSSLTASNITATGTLFGTGGLTVGTSQFVVQQTSGNVGIGTTTPAFKVEIISSDTGKLNINNGGLGSGSGAYNAVEHSQGVDYSGVISAVVVGGDTVAPFHALLGGGGINANQYALIGQISGDSNWNANSAASVANGAYLPGIAFAGQAGSYMTIGAAINGVVNGTVSNLTLPTDLVFRTSLTRSTALTEKMRISSGGNVGIGTTTPFWNMQIASSTKTFLTLSDMSAAANQKHWFLSSQGGNFYIGTSSDAYATSTSNLLNLISSNYSVGIGTTSPTEQLSVSGRLFIGGTGTSTIQNNLYVMGTLRSTVSYVGDLIFSNNFKFIETSRDAKIQSLFLQNQYGENIFKIDEKGELIVKKIKAEEGNFEEKLKIGSPQNRTGITIYDEKTGKPYCLKISDGKVINKEGECE